MDDKQPPPAPADGDPLAREGQPTGDGALAGGTMPPPPLPDAAAPAALTAEPDRYSAEALRDIVHGGTISVPVNNIDRELIQAWKSTTSGGDNEGKVSVTLMRAMNLVVYAEDEERVQGATAVIDRIVTRHPCRTIMIVNRSGATTAPHTVPAGKATSVEHDLEATLSAHCQVTDASGKQVCCEQISVLVTSPAALSRVSNIALNLLITDLPVFLWWTSGAPFNNMVLSHLEDSIDRLIIDSAAFPDPLAGLLGLSRTVDPAFRRDSTLRYAPGDLNWDRLLAWREATAQLFDSPEFTPSLWRIGSVDVQYAGPAEGAVPNPVQAFLFAGWLATRLNWEFHATAPPGGRGTPGNFVLTVRQGVRSIPIGLRPLAATPLGAGGIVSLSLTTNEANPTTFRIVLSGDDVYVDCIVEREGTEPVTRKVRYTVGDEAALLDSEMELFGQDPIYQQTLVMAGMMAWASMSLGRRAEISAQLSTENRQSSFDPRF